MNTAEKFRFLADRAEDEKEFHIGRLLYKYQKGELMVALDETEKDCKFTKRGHSPELVFHFDFKLKPNWEFTEDEKVILRNLPEQYKWIARHRSGYLTIHKYKPCKHDNDLNWLDFEEHDYLSSFQHIFQSIQWSDEEPCEFRKYL